MKMMLFIILEISFISYGMSSPTISNTTATELELITGHPEEMQGPKVITQHLPERGSQITESTPSTGKVNQTVISLFASLNFMYLIKYAMPVRCSYIYSHHVQSASQLKV